MVAHYKAEYLEALHPVLRLLQTVVQPVKDEAIVRRLGLDQHLQNALRSGFEEIVQHELHHPLLLVCGVGYWGIWKLWLWKGDLGLGNSLWVSNSTSLRLASSFSSVMLDSRSPMIFSISITMAAAGSVASCRCD